MEKYIVDGKGYNVSPEKLEEFLQEFPNAVKYQEPGKTTDSPVETQAASQDVTGSQSEDGSLEQPKPSKISTLTSSLALGFTEFAKGVENLKEGVQLGVAELLTPGEMSAAEKKAVLKTIRSPCSGFLKKKRLFEKLGLKGKECLLYP